MASYSVAEAKNQLPGLINKALGGEEVVITRHGKPVAEIRARRTTGDESPRHRPEIYEWLKAQPRTRCTWRSATASAPS